MNDGMECLLRMQNLGHRTFVGVVCVLLAVASRSDAAPVDNQPIATLPLASTLPGLHSDWTSDVDEIGPLPRDGRAQPVILASPNGHDALIALDPRTGRPAWSPPGRELDDDDRSHTSTAIIGDEIFYFDRAGGISVARMTDGVRRLSLRGTRCEMGRFAGNTKLAVAYCHRFSGRFLTAPPDGTGTRDEADWIGIEVPTGRVRYTIHADRNAPGLECSGSICVAQTLSFMRPQDHKGLELVAFDLETGKPLWRADRNATMIGVRGRVVALKDAKELFVLDLATGRQLWSTPLRKTATYYGRIYDNVLLTDAAIVVVKPTAVETLDPATGAVRERRVLPALPESADVVVATAGRKLLVFVDGGGTGDGYLLMYDGGSTTVLRSPGSALAARVLDDRIVVRDRPKGWTSYPLSPMKLDAAVATTASPHDRVREIIVGRRVEENLAELRAIPGYERLIADLVRTETSPNNIVALEALAQLKSSTLRDVSYEVLRGPDTPDRAHLIDMAVILLGTLDGPVPVSLLAPHVGSGSYFRLPEIAALLARGGTAELHMLDSLFGKLPGRIGWRDLCRGIDSGQASADGTQPAFCHDSAAKGRRSVALTNDSVWLRQPAIAGPAWLGAINRQQRSPPVVSPSGFEVKTFDLSSGSLHIAGDVHLQGWPTDSFEFTAQLAAKLQDSDNDRIPDATERCLGLSPDMADTDADGIDDPADPMPTQKTGAADPRVPLVRAALTYLARFDDSSLWSVAVVDAPPPFASVAQGVSAVALTAPPSQDCHIQTIKVHVEPKATTTDRHRSRRDRSPSLVIDQIKMDGHTGSVRAEFDYGYHGRTVGLTLSDTTGRWRVVGRHMMGDWIQ